MIRYAEYLDFDWIYSLYEANKFALGPCYPSILRKSISTHQMLVSEDQSGFCEFHVPKKGSHISIYSLCVKDCFRRQGIAKQLVEYIQNHYKYPIQIVCPTNSEASAFWQTISTPVGYKKSRKGNLLTIYRISQSGELKKGELF